MKPRSAVYNKGCLGKNIIVHLVECVPELGHTHPIQVKDQGIEIPCIFAAPLTPEIGDRGHDGKIRVVDLRQLRQFIGDGIAFGLALLLDLQSNPCSLRRHRHRDPVALRVLKMSLSLKAPHRKDLPVKLKRRDQLQKLLQMLILFPVQVLHPLHSGLLIHHPFSLASSSNRSISAAISFTYRWQKAFRSAKKSALSSSVISLVLSSR